MLGGSESLRLSRAARVPLIGLLHASDDEEMETEFACLYQAGYRTLKLKVGFDVEADLRRIKTVQRIVAERASIRIDVNQAYSIEEAIRFAASLDPAGIELLEQPCAAGDWEAHLAVVGASCVPTMLDESIYGLADIEKAAALGAALFVKVKLMKFVTLDALEAAIRRIKELGMTPILGNGVAGDLGCWMEACVAARHIETAGEMNGFLKSTTSFLAPNGLELRDAAIELKSGYQPLLDQEAVERHITESLLIGSSASGKAGRRALWNT
jgi:L-alanine-DL-glutamate epimerase-like enolase superfamily enzyme